MSDDMSEAVDSDLTVEVTDSGLDRSYWVARPWISSTNVAALRDASILVVPWENFRPGRAALFPEGTSDLVRSLRRGITIEVAIDKAQYEEIALYADAWRLPTLICQYAVIPLLINLLSSDVDRRFLTNDEKMPVSIELIVEGPSGRCISIKYKGPAEKLSDELLKQVGRCFPTAVQFPPPSALKAKTPAAGKAKSLPSGKAGAAGSAGSKS